MDKKRVFGCVVVWLCVSRQEDEEKLAGSLRTRCGVMAWVIMFFCSAIEIRVVFFLFHGEGMRDVCYLEGEAGAYFVSRACWYLVNLWILCRCWSYMYVHVVFYYYYY